MQKNHGSVAYFNWKVRGDQCTMRYIQWCKKRQLAELRWYRTLQKIIRKFPDHKQQFLSDSRLSVPQPLFPPRTVHQLGMYRWSLHHPNKRSWSIGLWFNFREARIELATNSAQINRSGALCGFTTNRFTAWSLNLQCFTCHADDFPHLVTSQHVCIRVLR